MVLTALRGLRLDARPRLRIEAQPLIVGGDLGRPSAWRPYDQSDIESTGADARSAGRPFGLLMMAMPQAAAARPYTVVSCDSAGLFGYSSAAWEPFANAGNAYKACPTGGGSTAGHQQPSGRRNLLGVQPFRPRGSRHHREPRSHRCDGRDEWHATTVAGGTWVRAIPSGASIMGLPHGQYCDSKRLRQPRLATELRSTRGHNVGSNNSCSAAPAQCPPGATIHAHLLEVTVDDPIPPSISLDGPLASRRWVSGRIGQPITL